EWEPLADFTQVVCGERLADVVPSNATRHATDHHHHRQDDGAGDEAYESGGNDTQGRSDPCAAVLAHADLSVRSSHDHRLRLDLAVAELAAVDLHLFHDLSGRMGTGKRQQDYMVGSLGLVLDRWHLPPPGQGWRLRDREMVSVGSIDG